MLREVIMVLCLLAVRSVSHSCRRTCGEMTIPYPFGLGDDPNCFRQEGKFRLHCNDTYNPPMLFLDVENQIPILNVSLQGQVRVVMWAAWTCYTEDLTRAESYYTQFVLKKGYMFFNTHNKLVTIGCDTQAYVSDSGGGWESGCSSFCGNSTTFGNDACSGTGCCEIAIPKNMDSMNVTLRSIRNHTQILDFNRCSYAFLTEIKWFEFFKVSDLWNFRPRVGYNPENRPSAPVSLDWTVSNVTCAEAQKDHGSYACGMNTKCSDPDYGVGYLCHCAKGYQGNPYLQDGCQDINECEDEDDEDSKYCVGICHNTAGGYTCSCPSGQRGDGRVGGSGCIKQPPMLQLAIGMGLGLLLLVLVISWTCLGLQKRKLDKLKKKFFQQNGGILLQEKLSRQKNSFQTTKIFSSEELKKATDNYHDSQILGRGGYGIVYKGILSDGRKVAIKKSKVVDKEQTEQFINEVLILSKINHRNVVTILGCCLETENPLLVYEFISNGTLLHHINNEECKYSISWSNRLRIATETAGALAYLHSSASQPIIHRDIKSANILLDENYIPKVADFGASRLIALDQTQLSTLVQGTMGYLDPEYLQTSLLTDKSDVYSFGVVLLELLTGRKAICFEKPEEERNLAMFFVSSLKANSLLNILEHRIVSEGSIEQLQEVANLARRCIQMNSEERPTMKEIAMELEGIRLSERHKWIKQNPEERASLLRKYEGCDKDDEGYDSYRSYE